MTLQGVSAPELIEQVAQRVCERLTPIIIPQNSKDPEQLVGVKEAAKILQVSVSSINRYTRDGHLQSRRAGKRLLYRVADLLSFTQQHSR